MTLQTKVSFTRFVKVTTASIVAQLSVIVLAGVQIYSLEDLKRFAFTLLSSVIAGALLGIEKFINWDENKQEPLPLEEEPEEF